MSPPKNALATKAAKAIRKPSGDCNSKPTIPATIRAPLKNAPLSFCRAPNHAPPFCSEVNESRRADVQPGHLRQGSRNGQARRKLTLAADYNRDEQLGTAVTRLNDIYARAIRAQDIKTGLVAQKELNKLLDLYRMTPEHAGDATEGEDSGPQQAELDAIRGHLLPLNLAEASYPLREHARIAAEIVRDHTGRQMKD